MKKRTNSRNATKIEFTQNPNSVFVKIENEPQKVQLTKRRAGMKTRRRKPAYPVEEPTQDYQDEDKPILNGNYNPYKYICQRIKDMLISCKDRGVEFNIEGAAEHFNTTTERIEEILDEVTRDV